jgi:hypothetical protein
MEGAVAFRSIVDGIRESIKPNSWTGLEDFADTVCEVYRKDLWQRQEDYLEFWFEKDAIIGVIEDITRKYDIKIRPLRGQSSLTFLHDAAWELSRIQKPVHIYYFGDHDPSGYSIEDSARERLDDLLFRLRENGDYGKRKYLLDLTRDAEHGDTPWNESVHDYESKGYWDDDTAKTIVYWRRLGFLPRDFTTDFEFEDGEHREILRLEAKRSDLNYKKFVERFGGSAAAELDSLPMSEIRNRVEQTILSHIDKAAWVQLQKTEELERESFNAAMAVFQKSPFNPPSEEA